MSVVELIHPTWPGSTAVFLTRDSSLVTRDREFLP
jgi:hypothetical protein